MEMWRRVWREGLVPRVSTRALEALRMALVSDDPRLVQGTTCSPPALRALCERRVETACALGYCGWQGEGLARVGEVEDYFQQLCDTADEQMAERAVCRFFLNWYDDTPRDEMRQELLAEVDRSLRSRPLAA